MKNRIKKYCGEISSDYDIEEINNVINILNEYNESLSNLSEVDAKMLVRIIDDDELVKEIYKCVKTYTAINPFD